MRFTFCRTERLRSTKRISDIYKDGHTGFCYPFRYVWLDAPVNVPGFTCQLMIAVSKRRFGKAAHRNLIRRRVREAYRLNKALLYSPLETKNHSLSLVIAYVANTIEPYAVIERKLIVLLQKLTSEVAETLKS